MIHGEAASGAERGEPRQVDKCHIFIPSPGHRAESTSGNGRCGEREQISSRCLESQLRRHGFYLTIKPDLWTGRVT